MASLKLDEQPEGEVVFKGGICGIFHTAQMRAQFWDARWWEMVASQCPIAPERLSGEAADENELP